MCIVIDRCDGARSFKSIAAPSFLRARAQKRTRGRTGHSSAPDSSATGGRLARVTRGETISGSASTVISSGLPELSKPSTDFGSGGLPSLLDFVSLVIIDYGDKREVIFMHASLLVSAAARCFALLRGCSRRLRGMRYRNFRCEDLVRRRPTRPSPI